MFNLTAPIFKLRHQAKLLSRQQKIPHHRALDEVASREGYQNWNHLASSLQEGLPAETIFKKLNPGDLALLGARPGHGKTLFGIELLATAIMQNFSSYFFTLDYSEAQFLRHLSQTGYNFDKLDNSLTLNTSDRICANYIVDQLGNVTSGFVVIDYLQLLDQKRSNPPLNEQVEKLRNFATKTGTIVVLLSQIQRSFDLNLKSMPDLSDVRLPNPVDCSHFSKICFLHDGQISFEAAA